MSIRCQLLAGRPEPSDALNAAWTLVSEAILIAADGEGEADVDFPVLTEARGERWVFRN